VECATKSDSLPDPSLLHGETRVAFEEKPPCGQAPSKYGDVFILTISECEVCLWLSIVSGGLNENALRSEDEQSVIYVLGEEVMRLSEKVGRDQWTTQEPLKND
jgi:hypothetical protein